MTSKLARSPRHPSISLREALARLREFYSQNTRAHVAPDVAVQAWGYKGLNGASVRIVSSLRQFGLLEDVGRDVKVSSLGLAFLLEEESSPDYAEAMLQALREPKVFAEILDEFPDGLPAERGLISHLVRKRNFSEDAARTVDVVLRDTLALVNDHTGAQIGRDTPANVPEPDAPPNERPAPNALSVAALGVQATGSVGSAGAHGDARAVPQPSPGGRVMQFKHEFEDGGAASLMIAGDRITLEDVDDLYDWLEIVKRTIKRRVGRDQRGAPDASPSREDEAIE